MRALEKIGLSSFKSDGVPLTNDTDDSRTEVDIEHLVVGGHFVSFK